MFSQKNLKNILDRAIKKIKKSINHKVHFRKEEGKKDNKT